MLLGNKCDMEDKRVVPKAKGEQVGAGDKLAFPSKHISARGCTVVGWFGFHSGV